MLGADSEHFRGRSVGLEFIRAALFKQGPWTWNIQARALDLEYSGQGPGPGIFRPGSWTWNSVELIAQWFNMGQNKSLPKRTNHLYCSISFSIKIRENWPGLEYPPPAITAFSLLSLSSLCLSASLYMKSDGLGAGSGGRDKTTAFKTLVICGAQQALLRPIFSHHLEKEHLNHSVFA